MRLPADQRKYRAESNQANQAVREATRAYQELSTAQANLSRNTDERVKRSAQYLSVLEQERTRLLNLKIAHDN